MFKRYYELEIGDEFTIIIWNKGTCKGKKVARIVENNVRINALVTIKGEPKPYWVDADTLVEVKE